MCSRIAAVFVFFAGIAAAQEPAFPPRWRDHTGPASGRDVRLSADGRRLLVGGSDGLRLWPLPAGQPIRLHADADTAVMGPRLTPDGRWVVGVRGAEPAWQLVAWDTATGREALVEPAMKREGAWRPALLGVDAGGAWVVRPAGVAERVEIPSGKVTRSVKLPHTPGAWGRLVLSPDARWLAVGGGTVFAVRSTAADADWRVVERHAEVATEDLPQPTRCPTPCGFSPDGRRLLTYDRACGVVAVWDLGDSTPTKLVSRQVELTPWTHLDDLTYTPDGKRFAFVFTARPQDRTATELRLWDAATLAEVGRIAPAGGVDGFALTGDGRRALLAQPDGSLVVRAVGGK